MQHDIPGDPADFEGDPVTAFTAELRERLPGWKVIADPRQRIACGAWRSAVAAEDAYLTVDAACRKPVIEHDTEIDRLASRWADVTSRAAELGWSPDTPLGNLSDTLINDPLQGVDESY